VTSTLRQRQPTKGPYYHGNDYIKVGDLAPAGADSGDDGRY